MENKKSKYIFIGILVLLLIVDIILFYFAFLKKDTIEEKTYENEYISFNYTSDYTIKEIDSKNISLGKDEKSGQISITITELSDDVIKRDEGFIINEAVKEFEANNKDYFSNYYGTYKTEKYIVNDFLYDTDDGNQVDLNYILDGNKLVLISYINSNQYFDLYEPNVLAIISSIKLS